MGEKSMIGSSVTINKKGAVNSMKHIIIVVPGTGEKPEHKEVQILPGTRARDVLAQLNLSGFQLTKPDGGAYAFADDLHEMVSDGQKVFATKADVEAGITAAT